MSSTHVGHSQVVLLFYAGHFHLNQFSQYLLKTTSHLNRSWLKATPGKLTQRMQEQIVDEHLAMWPQTASDCQDSCFGLPSLLHNQMAVTTTACSPTCGWPTLCSFRLMKKGPKWSMLAWPPRFCNKSLTITSHYPGKSWQHLHKHSAAVFQSPFQYSPLSAELLILDKPQLRLLS